MGRTGSTKNARLKAQYREEYPLTTEGLDDFFLDETQVDEGEGNVVDGSVVDVQTPAEATTVQQTTVEPALVQPVMVQQSDAESVQLNDKELSIFTEKQACRELDISKKALKSRLEEGLYKTFPGTDGKLRIILPGGKSKNKPKKDKRSEIIDFEPPSENSLADPITTVVDVVIVDEQAADPGAMVIAEDRLAMLVALVDKLNREAVAAGQRIGYLEAELTQSKEQLKTLPDLQSKGNTVAVVESENKSLRDHIVELKKVLELAQEPLWHKIWRNVKLVLAG